MPYQYVQIKNINYYYTRGFIKNQQTSAKLIQLFTSAWRNKNTERKGKICNLYILLFKSISFACVFSVFIYL